MRRLNQLLFVCVTAGLLAVYSPATADGHHNDGNLYGGAKDKWHDYNDDGDKNKKDGGAPEAGDSGVSLPINNNITFLIIVGVAIGCKIITDKIKSEKQ